MFIYLKEAKFIRPQQPQQKPSRGNDDNLVNESIRAKQMLVISNTGEQLGVLNKQQALQEAQRRDLDLVLVAPDGNPPVAKLMNYSKYRYDQQKKLKEIKKNQKITQIKEIRLTPTIQTNDLMTKSKSARKFLTAEDKVKVSIRFIGRMMTHQDIGRKVLSDFIETLEDISVVEQQPKMEGKNLFAVLAPKHDK